MLYGAILAAARISSGETITDKNGKVYHCTSGTANPDTGPLGMSGGKNVVFPFQRVFNVTPGDFDAMPRPSDVFTWSMGGEFLLIGTEPEAALGEVLAWRLLCFERPPADIETATGPNQTRPTIWPSDTTV